MSRIEPRLIHIAETDSTNRYLRMIIETERLVSGSIVHADFQTAGRGVSGSSWESEAGKNLTFSVLYYPEDIPANRSFIIAEMASLCVKFTLEKYIHDVTVKWPNDVYCGDKKITGILIENTLFQGKITQSIIGIGINVNQALFHSEAPNPVSMAQVADVEFDRMTIMNDFRQIFMEQCGRLSKLHNFAVVHDNYLNALYRKTGFHSYRDCQGVFEAVLHDIEPTGHLVLKRVDGSISRYAFKEVGIVIARDEAIQLH